ncbi:signal peptidase II [Paludibacterium purpuratum]|uniref:Lipoprotein signal peptidase n=1 Tax=Paludibacterium purpuratum TaxID=1144873 RepID=A0A4R7B1R4_9NEIS|nr:signal peptidase II [Paludibacterium purpuratum]TDR73551.1 signal peptidase II [Paludibacterium purpuratum]
MHDVRRWPWFGIALLIIVSDQLAKLYFNGTYQYGETRAVIPGLFNFTLIYNPGAAFSFLADAGGWQKHVFTVLAFAVSGWLGWNILRGHFSCLMRWAAALIMGGALGNVIDRMAYGHVVDFIQVYYHDWYYPAFNLADSAICIGAALMVLDSLRKPNR